MSRTCKACEYYSPFLSSNYVFGSCEAGKDGSGFLEMLRHDEADKCEMYTLLSTGAAPARKAVKHGRDRRNKS